MDQDPPSSTGEKSSKRGNSTEQPLSPKDERIVSANPCPPDAANRRTSGDTAEQLQSSDTTAGNLMITPPISAFESNEQFLSYGGYGSGTWDGYSQYYHAADGLHVSPVIYNENPSIMFHSGYGFNPEMAYGQYSPVGTPLPSVMLDGQLYSPQQIPFSPFYQQPAPPNVPSSAPYSPSELMASETNSENLPLGWNYIHFGSFGGANISQTPGSSPLTSPSAYHQPIGILGPYEQHSDQRSLLGYGSASGNFHGGFYQSSNLGTNTVSYPSINDRPRPAVDKGRRRERGQDYNSSESLGFDRNRGPRASKVKGKSSTDQSSTGSNCKDDSSSSGFLIDSCNRTDFPIDYEHAKFFIIKSFSEDNVHRSIKYNVWSSTPHGNKKLDAAYRKAKEMEENCPVFLLFSVNASGQFCGVAEMTGPVDFGKNADHWQHDRWSGQFPVRWHIIKDVPNSRFRHILLENNDNKPVTHSRDSQEVKLEHGVEMLKIFRDYDTVASILDDFEFYNQQEKSLREHKVKPLDGSADASTLLANETVNQISAAFAGALKVDDDLEDTAASVTCPPFAPNATSYSVSSGVCAPSVKPDNESEAVVSAARDSVNQLVTGELDGDGIESKLDGVSAPVKPGN